LTGLLWSDRDERQARHSLSEALPRPCGAPSRTIGYWPTWTRFGWRRTPWTLDCDRFAELCERRDWTTAASLVDGEFLEGLAIPEAIDFENWLAAERAQWRAQVLEALVQGVAAALARGDAAGAARNRPPRGRARPHVRAGGPRRDARPHARWRSRRRPARGRRVAHALRDTMARR